MDDPQGGRKGTMGGNSKFPSLSFFLGRGFRIYRSLLPPSLRHTYKIEFGTACIVIDFWPHLAFISRFPFAENCPPVLQKRKASIIDVTAGLYRTHVIVKDENGINKLERYVKVDITAAACCGC